MLDVIRHVDLSSLRAMFDPIPRLNNDRYDGYSMGMASCLRRDNQASYILVRPNVLSLLTNK